MDRLRGCEQQIQQVAAMLVDRSFRIIWLSKEERGSHNRPSVNPRRTQPINPDYPLAHLNRDIYVSMQGPSEMGASGKLEKWDRTADLNRIAVPTLTIGAAHDTMDPAHMEMMAKQVPKGRYLFCPNGSHLAMHDDQKTYFDGVITFIADVDAGRF